MTSGLSQSLIINLNLAKYRAERMTTFLTKCVTVENIINKAACIVGERDVEMACYVIILINKREHVSRDSTVK